MSTAELKNEFHELIDSITDDKLLERFLEIMKAQSKGQGMLWDDLSEEQQEEIMLANEEIKDPANLIPHDEMKKLYSKWL
jgi:hypothetical protein